MFKKIANLLIDGAIAMIGIALTSIGAGLAVTDVSAMKANKALPAPQPEAPAVEEAQNAEEPTAE